MDFSPLDLRPVLERLSEAGFHNVVVGEQAVNLWAMLYEQTGDSVWSREQPYASADLDFLGKPSDVRLCARALPGSRAKINDDPGLAGPNTGLVLAPFGATHLRVDLLACVIGVGTTDALRDAPIYLGRGALEGLRLRVLHPLHCLESKLACLGILSQRGRQDAKHTRLSVLAVREWLKGLLHRQGARPALKIIERLGEITVGADGLLASRRHGVAVEEAIPLDAIRLLAAQPGGDPSLSRFMERRQPQLWEHIATERREDLAFHEQLASRHATLGSSN